MNTDELQEHANSLKQLCLAQLRFMVSESPFSFEIPVAVSFLFDGSYRNIFCTGGYRKEGKVYIQGYEDDGEGWEIEDEHLPIEEIIPFITSYAKRSEVPDELKGIPRIEDDLGLIMTAVCGDSCYHLRVKGSDGIRDVGPIKPGQKLNIGIAQMNGMEAWYRLDGDESWKVIDTRI